MCICGGKLLHLWCTKTGSNSSSVKFLALGACTYDSVSLFTLLASDVDQRNGLDCCFGTKQVLLISVISAIIMYACVSQLHDAVGTTRESIRLIITQGSY